MKYKTKRKLLFGVSTSSHQIEGDNIYNDWWKYEKELTGGMSSDKACNSYNMVDEDIKLLKELGVNSYRFSIEWSRIEPKQGEYNEEAMQYYVDLIDKLIANNTEPIVTLHHFTNPLWFTDIGDWIRKENIQYFERYVDYISKRIGQKVKYWIIINEPNIYVLLKYIIGIWFPYKKNIFTAYKIYKNLILSHKHSYRIIKKNSPNSKISSSIQITPIKPIKNIYYPINNLLSKIGSYIFNQSFFQGIKKSKDFFGINFYYKFDITFNLSSFNTFFIKIKNNGKYIDLKDDFFKVAKPNPECLLNIVTKFSTMDLPVLITENGIATDDDFKRIEFLEKIAEEIKKTKQNNLNFLGYIHWTLVDNFEWKNAYKAKFGLFSLDRETFERTSKESSHYYRKMIEELNNI